MSIHPLIFPLADVPMTGTPDGVSTAGIVLLVWPALVIVSFLILRPVRALVLGYVLGYLFLPHTGIRMPFVVYDKMVALSIAALLSSLLTDASRWREFRFRWIDLPMLVWCIVPLVSALSNSQGLYEGASAATTQTLSWGLPYFLGRLYLNNLQAQRELAVMIFIGGLIYIPFCLMEAYSGPFLHFEFYGFHQHENLDQAIRDGGFRPMVFLQHGLAVGMYMTAATLMGWWLWWTGSLPKFLRVPTVIPLAALLTTAIFVKSTGAVALLGLGIVILYVTAYSKRYVLLGIILLLPIFYIGMRTLGGWNGDTAISYAHRMFGYERAQSLGFRLDNENVYMQRDAQRPIFGWGVGMASLIIDGSGFTRIVDSMWIIALSVYGAVGVLALFLMPVLSIGRLVRRVPAVWWINPAFGAAAGLITVTMLATIDNLANAMVNPVFTLALGGISSLALRPLLGDAPDAQTRGKREARQPRPGKRKRRRDAADPLATASQPVTGWVDRGSR